jgi:hypothetical protein
MKSSINNASVRQHFGMPSTFPYLGGDKNNRRRSADIAHVEREIAELVDGSTRDLRLAWRQLHRTDPPLGLSRDLIIRALAHHLPDRRRFPAAAAIGKTSRAARTLSRSNIKLPNWSIGRRRIYEWLGANYIAPNRRRVSVAIC